MKVIFLENKQVIYIDYLNSYLDVLNSNFPYWIRKLWYAILHFLGYIKQEENRLKLYCIEKDEVSQRMINNLKEKLLLINSKDIILPERLLENSIFLNLLESLDYNILKGKWLYKFLCYEIVQKIAYVKNANLKDIEITILTNDDSDINIENIKLLAKECKILNILTEKPRAFKAIEEFLFIEYGTIINVSTNKSKTCKYSDLILNFDFSISKLKKCNFRKKSILVQFTKEVFDLRKGVTIVFYKLNMPKKYLQLFNKYKNYNEEIFYESLLYYKTSFENLRKILKRDGVSIKYFIGCNRKIEFF